MTDPSEPPAEPKPPVGPPPDHERDTDHDPGSAHVETLHAGEVLTEGGDGPPPDEPVDATEPRRARRDPLPVLFGIGVLVLIAAVVFLWRHPLNLASFSSPPASSEVASTDTAPPAPPAPPVPGAPAPASQVADTPPPAPPPAAPPPAAPPVPPPSPPVDTAASPPPAPPPPMAVSPGGPTSEQLAALEQRIEKLEQQVDQLSHVPPPAPPPPPVDLAPLNNRITALENRPAPPAPPDVRPAVTALTARVDTLAGRQDQVAAKQSSDQAALAARIDEAEAKIAAVGKQAAALSGLSDKAARVARIQAATAALAAGQPLGELPDAPPALARYRSEAPPTEAALRLGFPAAAKAAEAAAEPDTGKLPFWQAVQNRAESLVTVRRGDEVIVGDAVSGIVARARTALDAGDLAGAVAALDSLTGPPKQAVAGWLGQAHALLDARAALAALAARA